MGSTWSIISRVVCVYTKKSTSGTFINIDTTSRLLTISHFYKLIPFVTNAFVGSSGIHTSTMLSTIYLTKMIKDRYFNAYFVLAFCIILLHFKAQLISKETILTFPSLHSSTSTQVWSDSSTTLRYPSLQLHSYPGAYNFFKDANYANFYVPINM